MRSKSTWIPPGMLAFTVALVSAVAALGAGAQDDAATESNVLRIGWGQDPQTLNPFVGLDEENYTIWALTWDLLVGFDPEDLSPTPGIAEELGRLGGREDRHLHPRGTRLVGRRADHV